MADPTQQNCRIVGPLARRLGEGAGGADIAEETVALWHEIDSALAPIIGKAGVAALYRRSLHVSSAVHPWMAARHDGIQTAMDPAALKPLLAEQSTAEAAAGSSAVLQTFHELLSTLIGPSLTGQLLGPVWGSPNSGAEARDMSP